MTAVRLPTFASSVVPVQDSCAVSLISSGAPESPIVPAPLGISLSGRRGSVMMSRVARGGREALSWGRPKRVPIQWPLRPDSRRRSPAGRPKGGPFLAMPPQGSIILCRLCFPSLREPPRHPDQRGFGCSFGSRFSREGLRLVLRPPEPVGLIGTSFTRFTRGPLFPLPLRSSEG